jgi:type III secretion protein J
VGRVRHPTWVGTRVEAGSQSRYSGAVAKKTVVWQAQSFGVLRFPAGVAALAALALGCTVPVVAGVEEGDANRIVVSLDRARVDATKEQDPATEGRFRVLVPRDDVARALATMSAEGLPRPNPAGVLSSLDKGALVPSRAAEHAQVVAGLAGDLERTLESVDGVLSARVHLNLPEADPLRDAPNARASASVLVSHRDAVPPIAASEVQRLLAGGVAGLAPGDVTVVMLERKGSGAPAAEEAILSHVGPIAVARSSARALQGALGLLLALVAVLAGMTLSLYVRFSRARQALDVGIGAGGGGANGVDGSGGGAT